MNKFKLKSKKILSFIVLICLFLSLSTGALAFEPALEDGTKDNPYIITSQNDLLKFKSMMVNDDSICARLEDDIELDGDWRAIKSYSGVFDGNYHKITLTGYSLFTRAEDGAIIKNLMIDGTVNGGNHVAPFIAYTDNAADSVDTVTMENCVNLAKVYGNDVRVAGLVGYVNPNDTLNMTNCYSYGSVVGEKNDVAPLAVLNSAANSNFINCYYLKDSAKRNTTEAVNPVTTSAKTEMQFASGEVAFLLGNAFGQKLSEPKDIYPEYRNDDNIVYKVGDEYTNTYSDEPVKPEPGIDGGLGTVDEPYQISTENGLVEFRNKVNNGEITACAVLLKDINLEKDWIPIGDSSNIYSGIFDGNGYEITNLRTNIIGNLAFFGSTGEAEIKNLILKGKDEFFDGFCAAFISTATNETTIKHCAAYGSIKRENLQTAGIVFSGAATVEDTYLVGDVIGKGNTAGIGINAKINNCFVTGTISALNGNCVSLSNAAKDDVSNSYFVNATASMSVVGRGNKVTMEQMQSGEIAYALGDSFGQRLSDPKDMYPVFRTDNNRVYKKTNGYGNTLLDESELYFDMQSAFPSVDNQGNGGWYYMYEDTESGTYKNLTWDAANTRFVYSDKNGNVSNFVYKHGFLHPGSSRPTAIAWKPQMPGIVRLTPKNYLYKANNLGYDVTAEIYCNDTILWSEIIHGEDNTGVYETSYDITVSVNSGDMIYFKLSCTNTAHAGTFWSPTVEYVQCAKFTVDGEHITDISDINAGETIMCTFYDQNIINNVTKAYLAVYDENGRMIKITDYKELGLNSNDRYDNISLTLNCKYDEHKTGELELIILNGENTNINTLIEPGLYVLD